MIYEFRCRLFTHNQDAIYDIIDKIQECFADCEVVNPDGPATEFSSYEVIENHHDEDPNAPCTYTLHINNQPSP